MHYKYCPECGTKLIPHPAGDDGDVPYCSNCNRMWFDSFSDCVLVLVYDEFDELALSSQWYLPKQFASFTTGYMKPGETAEEAAAREVQVAGADAPVRHLRRNLLVRLQQPANAWIHRLCQKGAAASEHRSAVGKMGSRRGGPGRYAPGFSRQRGHDGVPSVYQKPRAPHARYPHDDAGTAEANDACDKRKNWFQIKWTAADNNSAAVLLVFDPTFENPGLSQSTCALLVPRILLSCKLSPLRCGFRGPSARRCCTYGRG